MREHIITAVAALLLANSAVAGDVSIQVCLELDREKYCSGGSRQFEPGTVHVLFESSQPFKTKRAVGKLYALESGQRIFLGETAFEFTGGDSFATDTHTLATPGRYVLTFEAPPGMELARTIIEIVPPS